MQCYWRREFFFRYCPFTFLNQFFVIIMLIIFIISKVPKEKTCNFSIDIFNYSCFREKIRSNLNLTAWLYERFLKSFDLRVENRLQCYLNIHMKVTLFFFFTCRVMVQRAFSNSENISTKILFESRLNWRYLT